MTGRRGLVACLTYDAMCASTVSGLGTPLISHTAEVHGISLEAATWVLTSTLVVGAAATPLVSRMGDGGRRRILIGALLCVTAGSLIAAAGLGFAGLMVGRALHGAGYALVPLTISVARDRLSGPALAGTLATLSTSVAVGAGLANPLTGFFVRLLDYRAAFLAAAACTLGGVLWTLRAVPVGNGSAGSRPGSLDLPGAILLGGGLAASLLAIGRSDVWGWTSPAVLGLLAAGAALLAAWAVTALRRAEPVVDLRGALSPALLGVHLTALCTGAAVFGGMALVLRLVQAPIGAPGGMGRSLLVTGLLMIPMTVGTLLAAPLLRRLVHWVGPRALLPVSNAFVALAYTWFMLAHTAEWHVGVVTFFVGLGVGIAYAVMPALIVANVPPDRTSSATGLNQVLRISGGSMGSAATALVLSASTAPGAHYPALSGYVAGCGLTVALCLVALLVSAVMVRPSPAG